MIIIIDIWKLIFVRGTMLKETVDDKESEIKRASDSKSE